MSKAVLISIRPKWCEKICSGDKTIEVRKSRPKMDTPFKCYIYRTKGTVPHIINGKWVKMEVGGTVIGEFTCERISLIAYDGGELSSTTNAAFSPATCLSREEIIAYIGDKGHCYGWHITDLRIYDAPRELGEFAPVCRYKNDDGTCPSRMVACSYQRYDYNHDGTINLVECGKVIERPPQSWCYVEELP